jgi:uncharacterized protein
MLVSFSVSNFRSFAEEQTFSLVASKRLTGKHEDHLAPIPDAEESALRTAVLYGANGAGKSNLFQALRFLQGAALRTRGKGQGTGRQKFALDERGSAPTSFELQFVVRGRLYGFGLTMDDDRIQTEWLVRRKGNREETIYERVTGDGGDVTVEGIDRGLVKLRALATVGGLPNQTFLATIQANLSGAEAGDEIGAVLEWLENGLVLIAPDESLASLAQALSGDAGLRQFASEFLRGASTGVDELRLTKTELSEDELRRVLPEPVMTSVLRRLREQAEGGVLVNLGEGHELFLERGEADRFYRLRVEAAHVRGDGGVTALPLSEESDGTRRLLHLLPALYYLRQRGAVYFIDEIDRSLHPILVKGFLESFLRSCGDGPRQVIVTTHESNLLDQELLRRDEIWFAEKDASGATQLYSLLDFKVRNDLEIRKHYLQGRFGAVPFLGDLAPLPGAGPEAA